jgi:hypothetical protein
MPEEQEPDPVRWTPGRAYDSSKMSRELAYVSIGPDRYQAQIIADACRSEGLRVELLLADIEGNAPNLGWVESHRLLVLAEDADAVRAIVDDFWSGRHHEGDPSIGSSG